MSSLGDGEGCSSNTYQNAHCEDRGEYVVGHLPGDKTALQCFIIGDGNHLMHCRLSICRLSVELLRWSMSTEGQRLSLHDAVLAQLQDATRRESRERHLSPEWARWQKVETR